MFHYRLLLDLLFPLLSPHYGIVHTKQKSTKSQSRYHRRKNSQNQLLVLPNIFDTAQCSVVTGLLRDSHASWSLITLRNALLSVLADNLLLLLDDGAALAEGGEQAVGDGITLDLVLLSDLGTLQECEAVDNVSRIPEESARRTYTQERWQQLAPTQKRQSLLMRS